MTVREWDPEAAPDEDLESLVATLNAVLTADLPDDPPWRNAGVREYLCETMPGERRRCWLAEDHAGGGVIGHANVLLLADIGVVEVMVHPASRYRGLGRELVAVAARRAYAEGMASIGVEVIGGTPAMKFWEGLGFRCGYVEMRSVLHLPGVNWDRLRDAAAAVPSGYQVEYHPGTLPAGRVEAYAAAKAVRREAELPEVDLRPSSYDAQRLAASLDTLNRRGMKPYLVLAAHADSGEVAALTEVVVPTQHPTRADQYDTIVVPSHQGLGLERAIKARMLLELRRAEPQLTEVQTWNALQSDPMAEVNTELGFRADREWCEYDADVLELIDRFGQEPAQRQV